MSIDIIIIIFLIAIIFLLIFFELFRLKLKDDNNTDLDIKKNNEKSPNSI